MEKLSELAETMVGSEIVKLGNAINPTTSMASDQRPGCAETNPHLLSTWPSFRGLRPLHHNHGASASTSHSRQTWYAVHLWHFFRLNYS